MKATTLIFLAVAALLLWTLYNYLKRRPTTFIMPDGTVVTAGPIITETGTASPLPLAPITGVPTTGPVITTRLPNGYIATSPVIQTVTAGGNPFMKMV